MNFENLLREKIGLDPASVGSDTVERAVHSRMRFCGLSRREDYGERVQTSNDELQELIEAVIVPETWFFRDREAFDALGRFVIEDWLISHPVVNLQVLSVPCSTGEEPYSIVMALLEAGFYCSQLKVEALDISIRALAKAQKGIYGANSFRGQDLAYRDRHFEKTPKGLAISPEIRDAVKFQHGNLLSACFCFNSQLYDVIFCRNLLIYFDRSTQERVLESLGRMLAPDGLLFVGPAEAFLATTHGFKSAHRSLSFAFRKRSGLPPPPEFKPRYIKKSVQPRATSAGSPPRRPVAPSLPEPIPAVPSELSLDCARRLADAGKLEDALAACEAHMKRRGGTADGYYLLGVIHDAKGDPKHAEACYRKVLYLEPGHGEALTHLALLSESQGDRQGARRLRERARAASGTS